MIGIQDDEKNICNEPACPPKNISRYKAPRRISQSEDPKRSSSSTLKIHKSFFPTFSSFLSVNETMHNQHKVGSKKHQISNQICDSHKKTEEDLKQPLPGGVRGQTVVSAALLHGYRVTEGGGRGRGLYGHRSKLSRLSDGLPTTTDWERPKEVHSCPNNHLMLICSMRESIVNKFDKFMGAKVMQHYTVEIS